MEAAGSLGQALFPLIGPFVVRVRTDCKPNRKKGVIFHAYVSSVSVSQRFLLRGTSDLLHMQVRLRIYAH